MILCIGAFDGYHRGHQQLFIEAQRMAQEAQAPWSIVTFAPHPRKVLAGTLATTLFTEEEKRWIREKLGLPEPIQIPFTRELAALTPEQFLQGLDRRWNIDGIVVGSNFRFGRDKSGDGPMLVQICRKKGWELQLVPQLLSSDRIPVSSSRIRELLCGGSAEAAGQLLGYPFFFVSEVLQGDQRGRLLGFPTANFVPGPGKTLPSEGVYAGAVHHGGRWIPSAISVGRNPTFIVDGSLRVEAHMIDFQGDLYGQQLAVAFLQFLRPIVRYGGKEDLVRQLHLDRERSLQVFDSSRSILSVLE